MRAVYTSPLIKEGKIIRSTSTDKRFSNKAAPSTEYLEICDLNEPENKSIIDITVTPNDELIRLLKATQENIKSLLINLPRRDKDGTAYGLIVLTNKQNVIKGHMLNYYVTGSNEVYFIDPQLNKMEDQVMQELNMIGFRDEIFYLLPRPPEGFKVKIENNNIEIKQEPGLI